MKRWSLVILVGFSLVILLSPCPGQTAGSTATAKPAVSTSAAADFYKGKVLTIVVPKKPGNSGDLLGRLSVEYLKEIMGVNVQVLNKPEASGIAARNYVANSVKPDGLTLLTDPTGALWPNWILDTPGVQYDITKFLYIGGMPESAPALCVNYDGPYSSLADLQKAPKQIKFSQTTAGSMQTLAAMAACEVLRINAKMVLGFDGLASETLAINQKEADAVVTNIKIGTTYQNDKKLRVLFAISTKKDPLFPNVPTIAELAKMTADQKKLIDLLTPVEARMFIASPGTPADRVEYLRESFNTMFANKKFQKASEKIFENDWAGVITGKELQETAQKQGAGKAEYVKTVNALLSKYGLTMK